MLPRLQTSIVALFGRAALLLTLAWLYARVTHGTIARARELRSGRTSGHARSTSYAN